MSTDATLFLHSVIQSVHGLYGNCWLVAILTLYLGIASYTDVKSLKIPNRLNAVFLVLRLLLIPFIGFSVANVTGGIFAFFLFLIPAMIKMQKMGGDIKAAGIIGLYLGFYVVLPFLTITFFYSIVYIYVKVRFKKGSKLLPMAPFFLASHLTVLVLSLLLI